MNIYVGNLSYSAKDEELQTLFAQFGEVTNASVVRDRATGRSRGFGFVEIANDEDAEKAIEQLNGQEFQGRSLTVNQARPRTERPRRQKY
ncbi:MAG: RNA-binding protein [Planctomycetota bacterium]